ncbi:hypothetical protein WSK_1689 [Novosphingobium sp. Rr 2-17]|nr:hypothetical protein WSK_1689 [Novosphingobium sp. Rr 2-17]
MTRCRASLPALAFTLAIGHLPPSTPHTSHPDMPSARWRVRANTPDRETTADGCGRRLKSASVRRCCLSLPVGCDVPARGKPQISPARPCGAWAAGGAGSRPCRRGRGAYSHSSHASGRMIGSGPSTTGRRPRTGAVEHQLRAPVPPLCRWISTGEFITYLVIFVKSRHPPTLPASPEPPGFPPRSASHRPPPLSAAFRARSSTRREPTTG